MNAGIIGDLQQRLQAKDPSFQGQLEGLGNSTGNRGSIISWRIEGGIV